MRLEEFFIQHYRVLEDLALQLKRVGSPFQEDQGGYALDFLVGVNGTGKSTVLRLLGRLLARLHLQEGRLYEFDVPVRLCYVMTEGAEEVRVRISNIAEDFDWDVTEDTSPPPLHYQIDDGEWANGAESPLDAARYLPSLVVYSTGELQDWRNLLWIEPALVTEEADETGDRINAAGHYEWPGHRPSTTREEPLRGVVFIEPRHLPLVALCGLLADQWDKEDRQQKRLDYVLDEAQIERLLGFSLRIRYLEDLHDPQIVMGMIDNLAPLAKRVIRQGNDWLLVFELSDTSLDSDLSLGQVYDRPIQLFEALYRLTLDAGEGGVALQDVALFLQRKMDPKPNVQIAEDEEVKAKKPMLHLFRWLSDGEQSLIARMALFSLFRVHDYLILLDEPEVHFNDVWKRELIHVLDTVMQGYRSHSLITTHSSIALTDVPRSSIQVLHREGSTTTEAKLPIVETFGADPSDVLVHVFGTPSATGERSVKYVQQKLIQAGDNQAMLDELAEVVAPGYWRYRIQLERQRLQQVSS